MIFITTSEWFVILYITSQLQFERTENYIITTNFIDTNNNQNNNFEIVKTSLKIIWKNDKNKDKKINLDIELYRNKEDKNTLYMNIYKDNKKIKTIKNKLIKLFWLIPLNKEDVIFNFEDWLLNREDLRYWNDELLSNFIKNNYQGFVNIIILIFFKVYSNDTIKNIFYLLKNIKMYISDMIANLKKIEDNYWDVEIKPTIYNFQIEDIVNKYQNHEWKLSKYYTADVKEVWYDSGDKVVYIDLWIENLEPWISQED